YAAGVVLYETISGRRPFTSSGPDLLRDHLMSDPPPLGKPRSGPLPPGVDAIVARALAKEPKQRFKNAGEMVAALDAVLPRPSAPLPLVRVVPPPHVPVAPQMQDVWSRPSNAELDRLRARVEGGATLGDGDHR